ncbi:paf acetylhydrolase family protein [Colletotrichum truncatum]|uniref:Paf acetylhydrolase family protein n=1 Tax=Colletotrichum truncatum TaxID=5467 RepID=A0ACC3YSA2_COLTU|nr:paf acetylhydrolase family protein [Colletotrichum truncatum]KAF6789823.1 paf acetylhydrolase family protein [Colletotrichum truncatum]
MFYTYIFWLLASSAQAVLVSPPTGPYAVSMSVQGLTDHSRMDPYALSNNSHARQVMISTFLPVDESKTPCIRRERVPYMTPLVAKAYDQLGTAVGLPDGTFSSFEMDFCRTKSRACQRTHSKYPLVLFSPGWGNPRLLYGAMAREVASRGFAVVTIDHPYDPSYVEFPDGTVYTAVDLDTENTTQLEFLTKVRAQDTSFVLSHLSKNPVVGIDLDRTIMFGHSLGGATAAAAMLTDPRIMGGVGIDGKLFSPVLEEGLDRPFALVGRPGHAAEDPTWDQFYSVLRGKKADLSVTGTVHASFTDFPTLIASLNTSLPETAKVLLQAELGTLEFGKAAKVVAGIVEAFANLTYNNHTGAMFTKSGDASYPEVTVLRASI